LAQLEAGVTNSIAKPSYRDLIRYFAMSQSAPQLSTVPEDRLPQQQQQQQQQQKSQGTLGTLLQWAKEQYYILYEKWVPWLEDMFLKHFTRDNKASYATRDNLSKTKVTGIKQVDTLQDGVNGLVADQVGQDGLLRPVGDLASKHAINRAERQGKDENGGYAPGTAAGNALVGGVVDGGKQVAGGVKGGVQGLGGMVGLGK